MEYFKDLGDNVCLSGGAKGADLEWGRCAAILGHGVVHWSFPGHDSEALEEELVRLTDEQLELGAEAIRKAAIALEKRVPTCRLILRIYYQVAWATSCYAVTVMRHKRGTAWATTMFEQLHPESRNLWVFDLETERWFQFNGETYDPIESPPPPTGLWAGIGSRDPGDSGKRAIRKLMGCAA